MTADINLAIHEDGTVDVRHSLGRNVHVVAFDSTLACHRLDVPNATWCHISTRKDDPPEIKKLDAINEIVKDALGRTGAWSGESGLGPYLRQRMNDIKDVLLS